MTEEEKYINNLFEAARNESPKRSYEEVANNFEQMVTVPPTTTSWSKVFLKFTNLNMILMTAVSSLIIAGLYLFTPTLQEKTIIDIVPHMIKKSSLNSQKNSPKSNLRIPKKNTASPTVQTPTIQVDKNSTKLNTKIPKAPTPKQLSTIIKTRVSTSTLKNNKLVQTSNLSKTNKIKISSPSTIPILETMGVPTNSIIYEPNIPVNTNNTIPAKAKLQNKQAELLQLRYTDGERLTTTFLERIRSHGFSLSEKVSRSAGKIERIKLHLTLHKGLDWKIKLQNFEVFELKILLDEHKNPVWLAYRMSETGKFSQIISLNGRARSSHKFSKKRNKGHHTFTKEKRSNQ